MLKRLLKRKPPEQATNSIADEIVTQLKKDISYKQKMGFTETWRECEQFKIGDQWPAVTPATKDMPRPVLNMVNRVLNMKTSAVLQEPPTVAFTAEEGTPDGIDQFADEGAEFFTQLAKNNTWERVKMPRLLKRSVKLAANIGTAYRHWYWDQSIIGGNPNKGTAFIGDINGEVLGPDKVHLGNPMEKDINKQPYIIVDGKIPIKEFREAYADSAKALGVDVSEIQPDKENQSEVFDATKMAPNDDDITVIRRYKKVYKGVTCYIYCEVVAGGKLVRQEAPLYEGDVYPITSFLWDEREDVAYGVGETEGLIPNQKQINRMLGIYLLSLYKVGMPKVSYNENFVKLSEINVNVPGGIIKDTSPTLSGWRYVQPSPMPGDIPKLLQQLSDMSKDLAGANEAFLGESAPDNASAIMMLQKQANAPIQEIKDRHYESIEDDMRVWELFYKRFYQESRLIKIAGDNYNGFQWFRGTDYNDIILSVKVEAGAGSAYSESLMLAELKELKADGTITQDEYLEFLPKQVFPFAKQVQDRRKQDQMMMQEQQMMQQQQMMQGPMPPEQPPQQEQPLNTPLVPMQ